MDDGYYNGGTDSVGADDEKTEVIIPKEYGFDTIERNYTIDKNEERFENLENKLFKYKILIFLSIILSILAIIFRFV